MPHRIPRKHIRRSGGHFVDREATEARTEAIEIKATTDAGSGDMCALGDTLCAENAQLVRQIAHHLFRRRAYVNVDDLIEAGMVGLEEAMREYGHDTAEDFEPFASTFIRSAMLEFVRKANWGPASL